MSERVSERERDEDKRTPSLSLSLSSERFPSKKKNRERERERERAFDFLRVSLSVSLTLFRCFGLFAYLCLRMHCAELTTLADDIVGAVRDCPRQPVPLPVLCSLVQGSGGEHGRGTSADLKARCERILGDLSAKYHDKHGVKIVDVHSFFFRKRRRSVLDFCTYVQLARLDGFAVEGEGSATTLRCAKRDSSQLGGRTHEPLIGSAVEEGRDSDAGVISRAAALAWINGALREYGPMMTSMIGRLYNETFHKAFSTRPRKKKEILECGDDRAKTVGIARFVREHPKFFDVRHVKGNEYVVCAVRTDKPLAVENRCRRSECRYRARNADRDQTTVFRGGDRVLTLGDGDLSFSSSISLASRISRPLVVATTFDSRADTMSKYGKERVTAHIDSIVRAGGEYLEGIDATRAHPRTFRSRGIESDSPLFDFIVWNFPHVGDTVDDVWNSIHENRILCRKGMISAASLLAEDGELLLTVLDRFPYSAWRLEELCPPSMRHIDSVPFSFSTFKNYRHVATAAQRADVDTRYDQETATTYVFRKKWRTKDGVPVKHAEEVPAAEGADMNTVKPSPRGERPNKKKRKKNPGIIH